MLEEQLVDLVVYAMERSETEEHFDADIGGTSQLLWQHFSSQLIFFVLFQFASFPHMVLSLHQKVSDGFNSVASIWGYTVISNGFREIYRVFSIVFNIRQHVLIKAGILCVTK